MAVRIRLSRYGRLHRPYFRVVAIDGRRHREGEANEIIGSYDPLKADKNLAVDIEAVNRWVAKGALVSEGLKHLLKHFGYALPVKAEPAKPAKTKGTTGAKGVKQPWHKPSRRKLRQHAATVKAARKAKLAAEAPAKPSDAPAEPAKS